MDIRPVLNWSADVPDREAGRVRALSSAGGLRDDVLHASIDRAIDAALERHEDTMRECDYPHRSCNDRVIASAKLPGVKDVGSAWFAIKFISGTVFASKDVVPPGGAMPNMEAMLEAVAEYVDGADRHCSESAMERDATYYVERSALAIGQTLSTASGPAGNTGAADVRESLPRLKFFFREGLRSVTLGSGDADTDDSIDWIVDSTAPAGWSWEDTGKKVVACAEADEAGMSYWIPGILVAGSSTEDARHPYIFDTANDAIQIRLCGATEAAQKEAVDAQIMFSYMDKLARVFASKAALKNRIAGPRDSAADKDAGVDDTEYEEDGDEEYKGDEEQEEEDDAEEQPSDVEGDVDTRDEWDLDDVPLALRPTTSQMRRRIQEPTDDRNVVARLS